MGEGRRFPGSALGGAAGPRREVVGYRHTRHSEVLSAGLLAGWSVVRMHLDWNTRGRERWGGGMRGEPAQASYIGTRKAFVPAFSVGS